MLVSPLRLFSAAELGRLRDVVTDRVLVGDGCWIWTGPTDSWGYGRVRLRVGGRRRQVAAHRVVFELTHGPIRRGRVLDHLCGTWACVRPSHLEPVSSAENVGRSVLRERDGWTLGDRGWEAPKGQRPA